MARLQTTDWLKCAAAIAAALPLLSCADPHAEAADLHASDAPHVAAVPSARRDLSRELELAAEFRPYQEIDLYAKVSGYLRTIRVDVGDHVSRGELIAELEIPEMQQDFAQADAAVKRAQSEVERAKGEVRRAEAAREIRQLGYTRLAAVVKARPNLVAQQEVDGASAQYREADASLAAAKAALAASEEQVSAALANKERISTLIGYLRISAPFSGVITRRFADPGAMIQAGTASQSQARPVVRLSQIDHLRLVVPVPESIVPRIRVGSHVEVRLDSLGRVVQGTVSRFSNDLDRSTRTMETEIDLPNPRGDIMPGMYGYAKLTVDRRRDALAIPVQAVAGHGSEPTALVVNANNVLEERRLTLGIETPASSEVLSGLKVGELVVVGDRSRLKPGMRVQAKVMNASELSDAAGRGAR